MSVKEVLANKRPWWIECGDALAVLRGIPDGCVHCCVSSPPYFALRDYGTGKWEGGDPACEHRVIPGPVTEKYRLCRCGARRVDGQIGMEQTPEAYVARLVEVFREVRRVLRSDGTLWLNIGDGYNGSGAVGGAGKQHTNGGSVSRADQRQGFAGFKPKDLLGIPWALAFALRADGWWLRSEIIWCLSGGAMVYARTQKGDMPTMVKDLVRLRPETVQLWNGKKWTRCKGWRKNPRPADPLEIELRSGERIGCTREHLWPTQRGNVRADELTVGDVIQTARLPQPDMPTHPSLLPDEAVGWLVGFFMAEGFLTDKAAVFSTHAKEEAFHNRLAAIAQAYQGTCTKRPSGGKGVVVNLHGKALLGIIRQYVSGHTCKGKRLTNACWMRSDVFLRNLLQGYLDGDGHYDTKNDRWRLGFAVNDAWVSQLRTLAARLGVVLRLKRCMHQCGEKLHPGYRGTLRFKPTEHLNTRQDGEVIAIRPSRARQFWDIEVEDGPHLFALASGVLTHNCKVSPMPESVRDRPTRAHEQIFLLTKESSYFYDQEAERVALATEPHAPGNKDKRFDSPNGSNRNLWTWWADIRPQPYPEAHFACVDAETECLTTTGWKRHDQIQPGDVAAQFDIESGLLSWGPVEDVATYHVEDQEMVAVRHLNVTMLLTPNHRTIIHRRHPTTRKVQPPVVIRADVLKSGHCIPVSAPWAEQASNSGIGEEWAELLGWYVAEGCESKHGWGVDIYQSIAKNPEKVVRIRSLLIAVGAEFREATASRIWRGRDATMTAFNVLGFAAVRLRELAPRKELSWGLLGLPETELSAMLRGLLAGDGHTRADDGRESFIQKRTETIDFVQAVATRLGYASKATHKNHHTWCLYLTKKRHISLRGTNGSRCEIGRETYTGIVWCPKLPLGTWVARNGGRVFITGNTFPPDLPRRCIRLGTSERGCCPKCGAPWRRVVETKQIPKCRNVNPEKYSGGRDERGGTWTAAYAEQTRREVQTLGWQPSCRCDASEPVPCLVLDPFAGAATTVMVARRLGRRAIGIELNEKYAEMGRKRVAEDNPLFNQV